MNNLLDLVNRWAERFVIRSMTLFNLDPGTVQKVTDAFAQKDETLINQDAQLKSQVSILKVVFWAGLVFIGFYVSKLIYNHSK